MGVEAHSFTASLDAFLASNGAIADVSDNGAKLTTSFSIEGSFGVNPCDVVSWSGIGGASTHFAAYYSTGINIPGHIIENANHLFRMFGLVNPPFSASVSKTGFVRISYSAIHYSGYEFDFGRLVEAFLFHEGQMKTAIERLKKGYWSNEDIESMAYLLWIGSDEEASDV